MASDQINGVLVYLLILVEQIVHQNVVKVYSIFVMAINW